MNTFNRWILVLATVLIMQTGTKAQGLNCSEFLVTGILSANGSLFIDVYYDGTGFVNYPYVAMVTNQAGDTLSTGVMNFFGQGGGTVQTYETVIAGGSIPSFLNCTVMFVADSDTCFLTYSGQVQTATCADFCVTNVTPSGSTVWVEVYYGGVDFINYPHVAFLIDSNNDTLAYGNMGFFGQTGNTVLVHETFLLASVFPANFTGTVVFEFNNTVCQLPYPCPTTSIQETANELSAEIFPNPASGSFLLRMPDGAEATTVEMTDINGKVVRSWVSPGNGYLDISGSSAGLYVLRITTDQGRSQIRKLAVVN